MTVTSTWPWLGLVDLSRNPNGTFFREVHPALNPASKWVLSFLAHGPKCAERELFFVSFHLGWNGKWFFFCDARGLISRVNAILFCFGVFFWGGGVVFLCFLVFLNIFLRVSAKKMFSAVE